MEKFASVTKLPPHPNPPTDFAPLNLPQGEREEG